MSVVNFPRDANGRIIVDPAGLDTQAVAEEESPAAPPETPRPVRAISPGSRAADPLAAPAPLITRQSVVITAVLAFVAVTAIIIMARQVPPPALRANGGAPLTVAPTKGTAPSSAPTTAAIPVLAWSVDAFDAARHYVGPLDAGRPYSVRGAADATWLEIDAPAHDGAPASGAVWIRAVDLIAQPTAYGPTPVPTSAPAPVYVAPPPAAEIDVLSPSYQATDQAIVQQMHPAMPTPDVAATIRAQIAATHVSICATAAALGVPGGVGGACVSP